MQQHQRAMMEVLEALNSQGTGSKPEPLCGQDVRDENSEEWNPGIEGSKIVV